MLSFVLNSFLCSTRTIEGYKIFRNDRDVNGGGVAIYAKDSLPKPINQLKSDRLELLSLRIKPKITYFFIFVCWYRPPTSVVDDAAFENLFL